MTDVLLTPYLTAHDCAAAIAFYASAFGAVETGARFTDSDGRIGHAEISIGGATIFLSDEYPDFGARSPRSLGGSNVALHTRVVDANETARRLLAAGAEVLSELAEQPDGERRGTFPGSVRLPLDGCRKGRRGEQGRTAGARDGFRYLMNYIEPAAAREMDGLRLALTAHAPAPCSLSARAILDHHGMAYVPVLQVGGGKNEDLVAWTGHRNAPLAMYNDEAPRVGWLEILYLAERLGAGPSLIPTAIDDRLLMVGLANELIGENSFIWNLRIVMLGLGGPERVAQERARNPMYDQYRYSEEAAAVAIDRARAVMERLTVQLTAQSKTGRRYIVGEALSAVDIYWAYFSQAVRTFPEASCPTPTGMRRAYDIVGRMLGDLDTILVEQRDWVLAEHGLPLDF